MEYWLWLDHWSFFKLHRNLDNKKRPSSLIHKALEASTCTSFNCMGQGPVDVRSPFPLLKHHTSTRHGCHQGKNIKTTHIPQQKMALSRWRPEFLHDFSYLDDCETPASLEGQVHPTNLLDVNLKLRVSLRGILRNTGSWSYWQTHPINHMKSTTSYHSIHHSIHHSTPVRSKVSKLKVFESVKIEAWHKRNQMFNDLQWNYMTSSSTFSRSPYNYKIQFFVSQESPVTINNEKKHLHLPSTSTPHPETTAVGMGFSLT